MNQLIMLILGYLIHDAVQPTVVGQVLDKIALPGDLLQTPAPAGEPSDVV